MKRLGIIGGMGSRAGCNLLSKIIEYSPATGDQEFPEIVFHSNVRIPDRTNAILGKGVSPVKELQRSIEILNNSGVECIVMACVTSYHFVRDLQLISKAQIINPFPLLRRYIVGHLGCDVTVGLLATTGTIATGKFQLELKKDSIDVVHLPNDDQENLIMKAIYGPGGLKSANISNAAVELLMTSVQKLDELGADVIVGGCSEMSLVFRSDTAGSLPYIDVMDILARHVVDLCYNEDHASIG